MVILYVLSMSSAFLGHDIKIYHLFLRFFVNRGGGIDNGFNL